MISCHMFAGALDAPPGTHVSYQESVAVISVRSDVKRVLYHKPESSKCLNAQRGYSRIMVIMYKRRQKDLSSVYM